MARRVGRPRAGQEPLSRERILAAALRLVDEEGIEALSMRRLADELGVDAMAIYHHLPGKRAILAGVVALAFADLRIPPRRDTDWQDGVRAFAQGYRALARAHPHLVLHLISDLGSGGEAVPAATETLYAALAATGAPPGLIAHSADLVVDYVHGYALAECTGRLDAPGQVPAWLDCYPAERFPTMRRVVGSLSAAEATGSFEAGIAIILAGIRACLDSTARGKEIL